jgi:hypothetical protein
VLLARPATAPFADALAYIKTEAGSAILPAPSAEFGAAVSPVTNPLRRLLELSAAFSAIRATLPDSCKDELIIGPSRGPVSCGRNRLS